MPGLYRKSDHHFFMATAFLVARKSVSPQPVGAVIVNGSQIVGIGYNMEGGNSNHAEIIAMERSSLPLEDCTLYLTLHPCNECTDIIRNSGIKRVYYNYSKYFKESFEEVSGRFSNIEYIQYKKRNNWSIKFTNLWREADLYNYGITWDHFFMGLAYLISTIKNGKSQVGVVIVNDKNQIVSIGYKTNTGQGQTHAEFNAIYNNAPDPDYIDVKNCTLYTTLFPCNNCARIIHKSGINRVIYNHDWFPDVQKILEHMEVECIPYYPPNNLVVDYFIDYPRN